MNLIQTLEAEQIAELIKGKKIPEFRPGDTLRVGVKVVEGERIHAAMVVRAGARGLARNAKPF